MSANSEKIALCREMRQNPTPSERMLWDALRRKQLKGYKFRRQHLVNGYILDFYCAAAKLGIELDGEVHSHTEQAAYDRQRSVDLAETGIEILRFWNYEVINDLEKVLEKIVSVVEQKRKAR